MKYDRDEALKEVLHRRDRLLIRRMKRTVRRLSYASAAITAVLVISVVQLTDISQTGTGFSVYGAFLLSDEAGGYVLTGVLAFVLGVVFTLLCIQTKKMKAQKELMNKKTEVEERQ
jgi:hypothetical protein